MKQPKSPLACATVLTILLAACLGAGGAPATTNPSASAAGATSDPNVPNASVDPGNTNGHGTIEGIVTDTELVPLPSADVLLTSPERASDVVARVSTDANGLYKFASVNAGSYGITANKTGYRDAQLLKVSLGDGQTQKVNLQLTALAKTTAGYYSTVTARPQFTEVYCYRLPDGIPPLPVAQLNSGWHCGSGSNPKSTSMIVNENETGPLKGVIVELRWTTTTTACPQPWRADLIAPRIADITGQNVDDIRAKVDKGDPGGWSTVPAQTKSPLKIVVQRDGEDSSAIHSENRTSRNGGVPLNTSGRWIGMYWYYAAPNFGTPVDFTCMLQTTADAMHTWFFVDPAPPNFSAFDGS